MKKYALLVLVAVFALAACSKTVNNWVYIYTEVTDFEELQDSVAGAAMGKLLDEAAGASPYAFIYNRVSTFENVEKAADAFYDQVKDTVTAQYSLTLQKVLSTSAMKLADQTKEPIRKYSFNVE